MTPEEKARQQIDELLQYAGWDVQDREQMNLFDPNRPGVAVREAYLKTGFADYLLFVEGKALGVIEAKRAGVQITGVEAQSARYAVGLPDTINPWIPEQPLPFRYESTGIETFFTNGLDPHPRSRRVFAFHRPETLASWAGELVTLRQRLRQMPPLSTEGLWRPQVEAIQNLEISFADDRPRARPPAAARPPRSVAWKHLLILKYGDSQMSTYQLGRLQSIDLRTVWNNEATEFTPWLSREENLALLGETIGLDLELTSMEKDVGPFRADIVCRDTATDAVVLIENQLEKTDHDHLGKLFTYTAGIDAKYIVWIADRFTDEHRAALDWLNQHTDDEVNFFGLEVELWQIGNSEIAPRFNIVSQPNEWTKIVGRRGGDDLTELQQEQIAYWKGFANYLEESGSDIKTRSPRASHAMRLAIGRSGFRLEAFRNSRDKRIGVILVISGEDAKAHFKLLEEEKADIEARIGDPLEWMEKPGRIRSQIALRWHGEDPTDRERWPEQYEWLKENLELFYQVFAPQIKELDAAEYIESEDELGLEI